MRRIAAIILSSIFLASASAITRAQGSTSHRPRERKAYCEDDLRLKSATFPADDILDVLLGTPEAYDLSSELSDLHREDKRRLFSVMTIRDLKAGETDYLVFGNPPMSGADNDWFWIARRRSGR